jgi:hypothetical protein
MARAKEVDAWFAKYENPMQDVVQKIRGRARRCIAVRADQEIRRVEVSEESEKERSYEKVSRASGVAGPKSNIRSTSQRCSNACLRTPVVTIRA